MKFIVNARCRLLLSMKHGLNSASAAARTRSVAGGSRTPTPTFFPLGRLSARGRLFNVCLQEAEEREDINC